MVKKIAVSAVFLLFVGFIPFSAAENGAESFLLESPHAARNILLGIVLALGLAIIIIRALFNRGAAEKSAAGLASPGAGGAGVPGDMKLKPATLVEMHENRSYRIPPEGLTLGRVMDNSVVIKSPSVSRYHAKIVPEPEGYVLYDLGSKKGTFVNGEMVDRKILRNSDMLEIAREDFMFMYE